MVSERDCRSWLLAIVRNTYYGVLLPVATMLEKFGFQTLVEETITCSSKTRVMGPYKFVFGIVLGLYIAPAHVTGV